MPADEHSELTDGNIRLYSSLKSFALDGLSDLIRVLMENIDDALFELSEKSQTDKERNIYFEAMREIRIKRSLLQLGFDQAMETCFSQLIQDSKTREVDLDVEELSLVELDDIEDNIAIDNMVSKARPNFEDDLLAIVERLKVVLHRNEIDEEVNPFDPKAICQSFHNASEILDTDIQVKLIFYKLFDKYVMSNLGHFYREINEFFIQKGVLPDFKASAERLRQSTKFMANRIKASRNHDSPSAPADGQSADLPESTISNGNVAATDAGLLGLLQQALSGTGSQSATDGESAEIEILPVAQNSAYISALTGLQASNVADKSIHNIDPQSFKREMHQQLLSFSEQNKYQTNSFDTQIIDIVSMLFEFFLEDDALPDPVKVLIGRLQIPILKTAILDNSFFDQKKHPARQLLDSISSASLGWSRETEQEKLLIEKIESVVNYILTEFDDNINVFNLALSDFIRFLELESEKIEQTDQAIIKQELERDHAINEAQNAATALIVKVSNNRDLNAKVIDFLDTVWNSVLFHTCLSLGKESSHWNNIRRVTSALIWTLTPKFSEEERIKILRTLPALLRALSKGMELVKIGTESQNRIFRMLAQEHARVVKQTTRNIVTRVDDKTVWPDDDHIADAFANASHMNKSGEAIDYISTETYEESAEDEADIDSITQITLTPTKEVIHDLEDFTAGIKKGEIEIDEEIVMASRELAISRETAGHESDDFLEMAQVLKIGSWVEFSEPGTQPIHTRLSWKSNLTGKLVFVNRRGLKVKNISANGLAVELRSGRAKMVQSSSVFDRAINTIMTSIKH